MSPDTFDSSVLDPIQADVPSLNRLRCQNSYADLVTIDELAASIEQSHPWSSYWDAAQAGNNVLLATLQFWNRQLLSLLKAEYFFAAVAIDSLLASVCGRPALTMGQFLRSKSHIPLQRLFLDAVLPAYTVCVFRHKFVAHPELARLMISKSDGSGIVRLSPAKRDGGPTFPAQTVQQLAALTTRYASHISGLQGNSNPYEQVSLLFYGVSLGNLGSLNPDRQLIDELAEHTLCESLTHIGVLEAVDSFANAVTSALR